MVVKFHYDFLKKIIVRCMKMRSMRTSFLFQGERIFISFAMLCFIVIIGISLYPFMDGVHKEFLQEHISVGIYFSLMMAITWRVVVFIHAIMTQDGVHIADNNRKVHNFNQQKACQDNRRRYIDVRRKIV